MADGARPYFRRSYINYVPAAYNTGETRNILVTNPNEVIVAAYINIRSVFDGDAAIAVGDSGSANRYITTTEAGVTVAGVKMGAGAAFAQTPGYLVPTTNLPVLLTYTSTTGTKGAADIVILYFRLVPD